MLLFTLAQGLESTEDVGSSVLMMEYIGKVMLKEQFDKENVFFKRSVFHNISGWPLTREKSGKSFDEIHEEKLD